jgi:hypothetical protein
MYFCPLQDIEITQQLKPGDGGSLPCEAVVVGPDEKTMFGIPGDLKPGLYNLKNVKLHSNGVMSVTATPQTEWEVITK